MSLELWRPTGTWGKALPLSWEKRKRGLVKTETFGQLVGQVERVLGKSGHLL